jgi:ABC-2 type transport system permease protein
LKIKKFWGPALLWKERTTFFRDVKHWSQILLIGGLVFVYLFSVRQLPLDTPELRSLVSFLNVGAAGAVLAALGLRFTYPSLSLEGKSWWVLGSAPVKRSSILSSKFLFSAVPMTALALVLGIATNSLLGADRFTSWVSVIALIGIAWVLCSLGVGFGALFPMFTVENIHQIESSVGGFVYMAAALFYVGADILVLSWPMRMHFERSFGRAEAWRPGIVAGCAVAWLALNAGACILPWLAGQKALERLES